MRTSKLLAACLFTLPLLAAEPSPIRLQLAGSPAYGAGADAPVKDAVLLIDSTGFDGKSGMVRLQKGLVVATLLFSSVELSCETMGDFDKKAFLQRNLVPAPRLPVVTGENDYVVIIRFLDRFDPRKEEGSVFTSTITGKSANITELHLHEVETAILTPAHIEKPYSIPRPSSFVGSTVMHATGGDMWQVHFESRKRSPPFEDAKVVLRRDNGLLTAALNVKGKGAAVAGRVPVRVCEPVLRKIDEYAK